jgi:hypothetical protein
MLVNNRFLYKSFTTTSFSWYCYISFDKDTSVISCLLCFHDFLYSANSLYIIILITGLILENKMVIFLISGHKYAMNPNRHKIILFVSVRKNFNIIMIGGVLLICSMYYNTKFMAVTMVTIVPLYVSKCIVMNDMIFLNRLSK